MILDKGIRQTTKLIRLLRDLDLIHHKIFFAVCVSVRISHDTVNPKADSFDRDRFNSIISDLKTE